MTRNRGAQLLGALLLMVIGAVIAPAVAHAHASAVGSTPSADEVLDSAPSMVEVQFDSALLDMGAALVVRGADGSSITVGDGVIGDRVYSIAVDPEAPSGTYDVAYRVVSADGHTIEGSFSYVVNGPAQEPSATPAESSEPSNSFEPIQPAESEPAQSGAQAAPDTTVVDRGPAEDASWLPIALFAGVGLVVTIGLVGAILLRK
ncbi:MAG: copper resistance CopC family protein [Candidatus Nanopelagicales bacterium]